MPDDAKTPADPAASAIIRAKFGENWRSWAWFSKQWSKLALSVVGGLLTVIVGVGTWAVSLKTRVVVLETRVEPILVEAKVESDNAVKIGALDQRVTRIENNLDLDLNERLKAAREKAARANHQKEER